MIKRILKQNSLGLDSASAGSGTEKPNEEKGILQTQKKFSNIFFHLRYVRHSCWIWHPIRSVFMHARRMTVILL